MVKSNFNLSLILCFIYCLVFLLTTRLSYFEIILFGRYMIKIAYDFYLETHTFKEAKIQKKKKSCAKSKQTIGESFQSVPHCR